MHLKLLSIHNEHVSLKIPGYTPYTAYKLTLIVLNLSRKHKNIYFEFLSFRYIGMTKLLKFSMRKTEHRLSCMFNTMVADDLILRDTVKPVYNDHLMG